MIIITFHTCTQKAYLKYLTQMQNIDISIFSLAIANAFSQAIVNANSNQQTPHSQFEPAQNNTKSIENQSVIENVLQNEGNVDLMFIEKTLIAEPLEFSIVPSKTPIRTRKNRVQKRNRDE